MILIGDTHGSWSGILATIKRRNLKDVTLYHVGDIGVGFSESEFNEMQTLGTYNKEFKQRNIMFYGIRGNHDNPVFFDGRVNMDNLKLLPDYSIVEIDGKNVLGVGGAISIDRVPRRRWNLTEAKHGRDKRYHWDSETFFLDFDKTKAAKDIDIVVTHTSPNFVHPIDKDGNFPRIVEQFFGDDPYLKDELITERKEVTRLYDILAENNNISHWVYGHFHRSQSMEHEGTKFVLLDCGEFYEIP